MALGSSVPDTPKALGRFVQSVRRQTCGVPAAKFHRMYRKIWSEKKQSTPFHTRKLYSRDVALIIPFFLVSYISSIFLLESNVMSYHWKVVNQNSPTFRSCSNSAFGKAKSCCAKRCTWAEATRGGIFWGWENWEKVELCRSFTKISEEFGIINVNRIFTRWSNFKFWKSIGKCLQQVYYTLPLTCSFGCKGLRNIYCCVSNLIRWASRSAKAFLADVLFHREYSELNDWMKCRFPIAESSH